MEFWSYDSDGSGDKNDATRCPPVIGNVLVYRHMNHLTATYVRSLVPVLDQVIKKALWTNAPHVTADPDT